MTKGNITLDRQALEVKYRNSRSNLLLIIGFTVINIILLVTKSNSYFLFSAYIPYVLVDLGMLLCGKYPAEYYGEAFSSAEFFGPGVFWGLLAAALVIVALYFISWIFSKNGKVGWLIFALVFFSLDTVGMLLLSEIKTDMLIDIAFHVWVIISLASGIKAASGLKKLPIEEVEIPEEATQVETETEAQAEPEFETEVETETEHGAQIEAEPEQVQE